MLPHNKEYPILSIYHSSSSRRHLDRLCEVFYYYFGVVGLLLSLSCSPALYLKMEGLPDSSQVVEDPDFEFDEFVEDPTPLSTTPTADHSALTDVEYEEITTLMYRNLANQGAVFLGFKNALTALTSGEMGRII